MGLEPSKEHEENVKSYKETLVEIDNYEKSEWAKLTPGKPRLMIYWLQMVLCGLECFPRILFHGICCLLALAWVFAFTTVEAARERFCRSSNIQVAKRTLPEPALPVRQLEHHRFRLCLYSRTAPDMIGHNLLHPWQPYYLDGAEVSVFRPEPPKSGTLWDCCDSACDCCDGCQGLQHLLIKYFRNSFFALTGCYSFQCGSCLGPCTTCCCYTTCVGSDTESGYCKLCEPEEVRWKRWAREEHAAKLQRTVAFFSARPHLMKPPRRLVGDALLKALPPSKGLQAPLLQSVR